MSKFTFNVVIAVKEITVYEYEVEAATAEEAKEQANLKHFEEFDPDNGKCVDREEWVQELECEDDEYYDQEELEDV